MTDDWLNTDVATTRTDPDAAAAILEAVADALREAPDDARYKINLKVNEE